MCLSGRRVAGHSVDEFDVQAVDSLGPGRSAARSESATEFLPELLRAQAYGMTRVIDTVMSRMICAELLAKQLKYDRVAGPYFGFEVLLRSADVNPKQPGAGRVY